MQLQLALEPAGIRFRPAAKPSLEDLVDCVHGRIANLRAWVYDLNPPALRLAAIGFQHKLRLIEAELADKMRRSRQPQAVSRVAGGLEGLWSNSSLIIRFGNTPAFSPEKVDVGLKESWQLLAHYPLL